MKCELCGKEVPELWIHLKDHNVSQQEYYDKFMKKAGDGICVMCGKDTNFQDLTVGYEPCCSLSCRTRWWWSAPQFEEWRKQVREGRSKRMREANFKNWNDPDYYARKVKECKERMNDPKFKSNLDYQNLRSMEAESPYLVFYIIKTRNKGIKIGACKSDEEDKSAHFYTYKLRKNTSKEYAIYYGTNKDVADLEFLIKTTLKSQEGTREWFDYDQLDDIMKLVEGSILEKLELTIPMN